MTAEPKPREFPRGRWHQIEQVEAVETGIINTSEYFFLGMIDALCNWKKQGCWASDDYLAERMGLSPRQIRNIIFHLSGHPLLRNGKVYSKAINPPMLYVGTKETDHSRILVTRWFLAECDGTLPGVAFPGLETNFQSSTSALETNFQGLGNLFPKPVGNKFPKSNNKKIVGVNNKNEGVSPGKAGATSPSDGFGIDNEPKCGNPRDYNRARSLWNRLIEKGLLDPKSKYNDWVKEFFSLREKDHVPDDEIEETLRDYLPLISITMTSKEEGCLPQAFSARTFRQKFLAIRARLACRKKDARRDGEREEYNRLEALAEEAKDKTGYWVDAKGNVRDEKGKVIRREDEDNEAELWQATIKFAEYVRQRRQTTNHQF